MTRTDRKSRLRHLAWLAGVALLLLLGVGVYAAVHPAPAVAPDEESPAVLRIEEDGWLYTYHVPTDTEGLFDVQNDPRCLKNLLDSHRTEAARLRRTLERRLGVRDLREMLDPNDPTVENLRGLGYL